MKILAIDPGYERVGIAVLEKNYGDKKEKIIFSECFKTSAKLEFSKRLFLIGKRIEEVISLFNPESLSIEKLYFEKNQKTAMGVSEARGVIIYECAKNKMSIFEYTPLQVKIAVSGYGKATKDMVMSMVTKLVVFEKISKSDDELDAIALGITYFATEKMNSISKKHI